MLDKIMINKDQTEVTIYYDNRTPVVLSSSDGKVLDLLVQFMAPIGCSPDINWTNANTCNEDTAIVYLEAA